MIQVMNKVVEYRVQQSHGYRRHFGNISVTDYFVPMLAENVSPARFYIIATCERRGRIERTFKILQEIISLSPFGAGFIEFT